MPNLTELTKNFFANVVQDKGKYITTKDKILGFFSPSYITRRRECVQQQLEADGWPRTVTLAEAEERMGITKWANELQPSGFYRNK